MAHGDFHFPATFPASWHLLIRIMSSAVPREKIWVLLAKRIISQKYSSEHQLQYSTLTYALLSSSLRKKKRKERKPLHRYFLAWNYHQRLLCSCVSQANFNVIAWTFLFPTSSYMFHCCTNKERWLDDKGIFQSYSISCRMFLYTSLVSG